MSEQDIFAGLFDEARRSMMAASQGKPYPPRMMLAALQTMGRHLEYSEAEIAALLEPTILHQCFLANLKDAANLGVSSGHVVYDLCLGHRI